MYITGCLNKSLIHILTAQYQSKAAIKIEYPERGIKKYRCALAFAVKFLRATRCVVRFASFREEARKLDK